MRLFLCLNTRPVYCLKNGDISTNTKTLKVTLMYSDSKFFSLKFL